MCRQYTPSLFLTRVMFQNSNFSSHKATVNAVVVGLRLSRPPYCPHLVSSQVATAQRPKQVRARQFQRMIFYIIGCRRQSADPETQGGHPLRQILSIERRASNLSAHCNIANNKRRLRTHPCFTPEVMGQLRLDLHLPRTSPDWPSYTLDNIHII